jgi:hypothetical protein
MVEVNIKRVFFLGGVGGLEVAEFLLVTSFFNTPVKSNFKFSNKSSVNSVIVNFSDAAVTKLYHCNWPGSVVQILG